jgi:hypothetical protein
MIILSVIEYIEYTDMEGTRLSSEIYISSTGTDLTMHVAQLAAELALNYSVPKVDSHRGQANFSACPVCACMMHTLRVTSQTL